MRRRGWIVLVLVLAVLANNCSVPLFPSTNARRMATPEATEVTQPSATPQMPTSTAKPSSTLTETPRPTATSTQTSEPTPTPEPTKASMPEGMDRLGAEMVAQMVYSGEPRNRWEYKGVAYWDEKKGRLELDPSVTSLDFAEHKDLFTRWAPADVEERFIASGYTEVPVMVDSEVGGMCEGMEKRSGIGYRDLPVGTEILSPVTAVLKTTISSTPDRSRIIYNIYFKDPDTNVDLLKIHYSSSEERTVPSLVSAGSFLLTVGSEKLQSLDSCWASSLFKETTAGDDQGAKLNTMMRDDLGRLVVIRNG